MPPPAQRPHRSRQNYATPRDFIEAALYRLRIQRFAFDFAADRRNAKADRFWTRRDDSLARSGEKWAEQLAPGDWGWLNPPFGDIDPWAEHCAQVREAGRNIAFLVPASVGANWYRDHVEPSAFVLALNGRLAFMPSRPSWLYPKDCILCLYSPRLHPGFRVWNWRETLEEARKRAA